MRLYTSLSILSALAFLAGSIFFFIQDDDPTANVMLVLSSVVFIGIYYLLKWLYYLQNSATLNEVSFVIILPLAPLAPISLKSIIGAQFQILVRMTLDVFGTIIHLTIDILDLLSFPYYLITIFFILRTYLRYPFIRLTGYSRGGLPSTLIAIILSAGLPFVYVMVGLFTSNALLLYFSLCFLMIGLIGLFV